MHSFSAYLVRVGNGKGQFMDIAKMVSSAGINYSLIDVFQQVLAAQVGQKNGYVKVNGEKKLLRYNPPIKCKKGSVYVRVDAGEYGFTQTIVDTQTLNTTHNKTTEEAGLLPFFIRLVPTKDPHVAILISHKQGTLGVKTQVNDLLGKRITQIDPIWSLRIEKIVPQQIINKLLTDGTVKAIRFISRTAPSDIADKLDQYASDQDTSSVELVIKARRGRSFGPQLLRLIKDKKPVTGLVTLPNIDYERMKVDIEIGNRRKVIDLTSIQKIIANVDITDDLTLDGNGHPTTQSLYDLSTALADSIEAQI